MKIELIIIGNELLNGKIKDKNIHWLSVFCHTNNHHLTGVQIIPDNKEAFNQALNKSLKTAEVVITSGGLGPTKDDLTKLLMAEYFSKNIIYSKESFEITESHYKRGQRIYDPEKVDYANIPQDFFPLFNPTGYAPGLGFKINANQSIFSTPGVPSEFQSMIAETIKPFMSSDTEFQKHIIFKTWRLPESKIFTELAPTLWEQLEQFGEVSSLPHLLGVDIGVKITNPINEKKVIDLVRSTPINDFIWNIGPETLEEVIIKKAIDKNIRIGFAESCTGGLLGSRITDISGSSAVFWGSIVSYSNEVKIKALGVQADTLNNFGAVSLETAKEMAQGALNKMNLDLAISTTGIAGPGGGSDEKPVGTVGIGIATKDSSSSEIYHFKGNREELKFRFSQMALFKMLETINSL